MDSMVNNHNPDRFDAASLTATGIDVLRAYEDAATEIGRLDAAAKLATAGLRELLVLRCVATPAGAGHTGMIALARADGEGDESVRTYDAGLRAGAARARGGALPSVASLHELLCLPLPAWPASPVDSLLRDAHERTPPVLKAVLVALAIRAADGTDGTDRAVEASTTRIASLAVTLVLCVGGATTDSWLTLPPPSPTADHSLRDTFTALAREARAAARGLQAARELCDADEQRVRDSLGRAAYSALDVLALLRDRLVIGVPEAAHALGLTPPTAGAAVARLVELGVAREVTGKARSRAFAYDGVVRALAP
jgi:hypothetical protein